MKYIVLFSLLTTQAQAQIFDGVGPSFNCSTETGETLQVGTRHTRAGSGQFATYKAPGIYLSDFLVDFSAESTPFLTKYEADLGGTFPQPTKLVIVEKDYPTRGGGCGRGSCDFDQFPFQATITKAKLTLQDQEINFKCE